MDNQPIEDARQDMQERYEEQKKNSFRIVQKYDEHYEIVTTYYEEFKIMLRDLRRCTYHYRRRLDRNYVF